ncbi:homeobox-leucine zipper protein ATHB-12-like [Cucurbita moschata]|uniref:Homeobox-leucine zipper protein n=1 Tax=Cucurbita moschata TaxID=3662 RepID=A0A6J1G2H1_CUCMO|nr:homeobox-leucine zipper protein ATHB-12-like [Cucurbita moschata]
MERPEYIKIQNLEVASSQTCPTPRRKKKKKKKSNNMNKRRFSDEQIRSLESIFYSSDSKLDSRKKVQLAAELGLQPRQISIWFQNRRARWKSKQMENDFRSLRASYDNLASQFRTLQEENNSLLSQLQKLGELVQEEPGEGCYSTNFGKNADENQAKLEILEDEPEQNGVTYLNNNSKTENGGGHQATHLLEGRSNGNSHSEEQVWCDFESDGGVIFEYQPCSSLHLQGLSFWG